LDDDKAAAVAQNNSSQTEATVVAPPAKRKVIPIYPYDMIVEGKSGWADANFLIDYTGRPLFTVPAGSSDGDFGKAVVAMVEASEFIPNRRDKHPVMTPALEHFRFEGEQSLDPDAKRVLAELRKPSPAICASGDLDERPKAMRQDSPVYPRALKDDGITGQAEIEFIVARDGRVLFPRIVSATHEDFGWAAAVAVGQWRFQPPQRNGQAVETRMRVPVLFDAHKLASSD
jgi:TonB family protein